MILISKWYTDAGKTHLCLSGSAQLTLSHERIGGTQEYLDLLFVKQQILYSVSLKSPVLADFPSGISANTGLFAYIIRQILELQRGFWYYPFTCDRAPMHA
ncbi:MAG: hypothetical protein JWN90_680 [Parcubacteria group bacterium]|nr:hypothetical protein [Parcubacteria group bacterium]